MNMFTRIDESSASAVDGVGLEVAQPAHATQVSGVAFLPVGTAVNVFDQSIFPGGDQMTPKLVGDINADGVADLVAFGNYVDLGGYRTASALGNGDTTFAESRDALAPFSGEAFWSDYDAQPQLLGDIDDDGHDDVVAFGDEKTISRLTLDDGTFREAETAAIDFSRSQHWESFEETPRQIGDINGDGAEDIVGFGDAATLTALSRKDGTFSESQVGIENFAKAQHWDDFDSNPRLLGDVDGDGADDIVGFGDSHTMTALADGHGGFAKAKVALENFAQAQYWESFDDHPRAMGDVNGDGLDDIVGFGDSATFTALSHGDGTFGPATAVTSAFSRTEGWPGGEFTTRTVADVDGDGREDIIGMKGNDVSVSLAVAETKGDVFAFEDGFDFATISDFNPDEDGDRIDFSNVSAIENIGDVGARARWMGDDLLINAGTDELVLEDFSISDINSEDFIF